MKIKNISDHDERDFFCIETLFTVSTKYIMMFFDEMINNEADDVVFLY